MSKPIEMKFKWFKGVKTMLFGAKVSEGDYVVEICANGKGVVFTYKPYAFGYEPGSVHSIGRLPKGTWGVNFSSVCIKCSGVRDCDESCRYY